MKRIHKNWRLTIGNSLSPTMGQKAARKEFEEFPLKIGESIHLEKRINKCNWIMIQQRERFF